MRRAAPFIAVVVLGCTPTDASWLGFPDTTAKTLVLASREAKVVLTAVDLENEARRDRLNIRLGDAPPYRTVYALLYDRSLDRMGFASGQLPEASNAAEGGLLPKPDLSFETEVVETNEVEWKSAPQLPDDISSFRVRASAECASFEAPSLPEEVEGRAWVAVALDDENVLIGGAQDLFVLNADGKTDIDNLLLQNARAAWMQPDRSTLWFGDVFGRIYRGTPSIEVGVTDVEMVADTQLGQIYTMDGGLNGAGEPEIFFATSTGNVGRIGANGFTAIGVVPQFRTTLAWIEPGMAFLADEGVDQLYRISPNSIEVTAIGAESQIMDLTRHDRFGAIAGTAEGHFYAYRGLESTWGRVPGADFGWWSLASAPYEDGFMFVLASGFFGQYKQSRGFCESSPILQILQGAQVVPLERDIVIVAVPDERPRTTILYVPRAPNSR